MAWLAIRGVPSDIQKNSTKAWPAGDFVFGCVSCAVPFWLKKAACVVNKYRKKRVAKLLKLQALPKTTAIAIR